MSWKHGPLLSEDKGKKVRDEGGVRTRTSCSVLARELEDSDGRTEGEVQVSKSGGEDGAGRQRVVTASVEGASGAFKALKSWKIKVGPPLNSNGESSSFSGLKQAQGSGLSSSKGIGLGVDSGLGIKILPQLSGPNASQLSGASSPQLIGPLRLLKGRAQLFPLLRQATSSFNKEVVPLKCSGALASNFSKEVIKRGLSADAALLEEEARFPSNSLSSDSLSTSTLSFSIVGGALAVWERGMETRLGGSKGPLGSPST